MKNKNIAKNNFFIVKQIVYDSLFFAIILVFTLVPNIGYITIGPSSFQFISVFVIFGAALFGWKRGLLYGFFFGLSSLLKVLTSPVGWFDALFIFPWNSILPRMLFGLITGLIFDGLKKILARNQYIVSCIAVSFFASILHSFLVLSCIFIFNFNDVITNMGVQDLTTVGAYVLIVLSSLVGIQVVGEMLIAGIISPLLISIVYKTNILKYNGKEEKIKISRKKEKEQELRHEIQNILAKKDKYGKN